MSKRTRQKSAEIEEINKLLWYVDDNVRLYILDMLRVGANIPEDTSNKVLSLHDYHP